MLEIHVTVACPDLIKAAELLSGKPAFHAEPAAPAPTPAPVPTAPAPAPAPAPVAPAPMMAPVTAAPAFTLPQIAKAGADLMAANPALQPALVELLRKYGAQTVQDLPQDKLGAFAAELRQMGARI